MHDVLSILRDVGEISVAELVGRLGVSPASLRRDLVELDRQGLVHRTYGHVAATESRAEIPVLMRESEASASKRAIARFAARLLEPGPQAVAVSGGTTTSEVVRALATRDGLTVVTNAVSVGLEASRSPRLKVVLTGGTLRATSLETAGPLAEAAFAHFNVSTAYLGTDGISIEGGVTTHNENEARTNGTMVRHAARVIVVCDGSKVGNRTMARVANVSDISVLITDDHAPEDELDAIRALGVSVYVVEARPDGASASDRH